MLLSTFIQGTPPELVFILEPSHSLNMCLYQLLCLCSHVERTMAIFRSMNLEMAETANLTKINKQHLLQLVAENNIVMTEIIAKLGVHER